MKKRFIIILVIPILILVKLIISFTTNEILISNYNKGNYSESLVKTLYILNFSESYIAYYNHGNILYRQDNFKEAISKYKSALEKNPSKNKVCDIRINLSLSITATIDANNKSDALSKLKEAKNVLYEDNCAHANDDNGDSKEAEKLEEELKQLENELNGEDNDPSGGNDKPNDENNPPQDEKTIEEKLKENQKDSSASRQNDINFDENGITYYDGKSW